MTVINKLNEVIRNLLNGEQYIEFFVGRNGEFDIFASSAVVRARKKHDAKNSFLILVLPYQTAEYAENHNQSCLR